MNNKFFLATCLIALIAALLSYQTALAHESITVGDYEIVYGWVNEPPIAGQLNGVEIFVNDTSGGSEQPVEEHITHSLVVELSYGGESKTLTMEPVFDTAGAFDATVIPAIPGLYSLKFSGTLGDTPVDVEVELEEVQAADAVQFPVVDSSQAETNTFGMTEWLAIAGFISGLAGLFLSLLNMRKTR
jgi:hypothetical protein